MLWPSESLHDQLLFPPPFSAAWQCCGAGELVGQLELRGVPLHGSGNEQLKGPLEEPWCGGMGGGGSLRFRALGLHHHLLCLGHLLVSLVLLRRGGGRVRGGGVGCGRARSAAGPPLKALQTLEMHGSHPQTGSGCSDPGGQPVQTQRGGGNSGGAPLQFSCRGGALGEEPLPLQQAICQLSLLLLLLGVTVK